MLDQGCYSVNGRSNNNGEIMVPYSRVLYIAWDKDTGARLKRIRNTKKISRIKLAELTEGMVSERTIVALEGGEVDAVSREKLDSLLKNLGSDVRSLFPTATVNLF